MRLQPPAYFRALSSRPEGMRTTTAIFRVPEQIASDVDARHPLGLLSSRTQVCTVSATCLLSFDMILSAKVLNPFLSLLSRGAACLR